jgi:hypothetical protein
MFPDKNGMVRNANALWAVFVISPVVYISTTLPIVLQGRGLARNTDIIPLLFLALAAVSISNIGVMVFIQTSPRIMADRVRYDPIGRVYLILSTVAILSEAHSIYGLVLTLLSGSIFYVLGFTLVTWICLFWVRLKFKKNLGRIPDK